MCSCFRLLTRVIEKLKLCRIKLTRLLILLKKKRRRKKKKPNERWKDTIFEMILYITLEKSSSFYASVRRNKLRNITEDNNPLLFINLWILGGGNPLSKAANRIRTA